MAAARLAGETRVTVRVDSSVRMGGGHAMRCLTLADALAARGAQVTFVTAAMLPGFADRITAGGHLLRRIAPGASAAEGVDWDSQVLPADAQRLDAQATCAAADSADLTIVDHYRLDAVWETAARTGKLLAIDDLANRRHACDFLLDQNFGATSQSYATLTDGRCKLLLGAAYALLRPDFAIVRPVALRRRREAGTIERLLISLGSTDVGGVTESVVTALLSTGLDCAMDVVLPSSSRSLPKLRAYAAVDSRLAIHLDSDAMAELMAQADLAIGAAGTTSWERCCLGLPTITLILADNQRQVANQLSQAQAAIVAATPEEAAAHAVALTRDPALLSIMVAASAAIIDGRGARRVVDALIGPGSAASPDLHLRPGVEDDCERLWLWRNDPSARAMAKSDAPVTWPEHRRWFGAILSAPTTKLLIAERDGVPLAMVRFDQQLDGDDALVSINVAPASRGNGIGRETLSAACGIYLADHGDASLRADIHVTNAASLRIFTQVGFAVRETLDGFYRLALSRSCLDEQARVRREAR